MKKISVFSLAVLLIVSISNQVMPQEKAVSINEDSLYSEVSLKKDGLRAFNKKEYQKAIFIYKKLVKKFPKNDEYLIDLANSMFMNKDYNDAFQKYSFIINNSTIPDYISQSKTKINEIKLIAKNLSKANKNSLVVKKKSNEIEKKLVSINDDDSNNYLCNSSDPTIYPDEDKETFRRWEKEDLPLKIYIPKVPDEYDVPQSDKYREWIKMSIERWTSKIPQLVKYTYVDSASNANIVINWSNYFKNESWGVAQMPHFQPDKNRRFSNVNLAVRAKLSDKEVFFSQSEFIQIVTHEFGHALGLSHSYKQAGNDDIMYPDYRVMIMGNEPDITQRDVNSLIKLYSLSRENYYECK